MPNQVTSPTQRFASSTSKIEMLDATLTLNASDKRQKAYEGYLNSVISQMKTLIAHGVRINQ